MQSTTYQTVMHAHWHGIFVLLAVPFAIGSIFLFWRYAGLSREKGFLAWSATVGIALSMFVLRAPMLRNTPPSEYDGVLMQTFAQVLCVFFLAAFVVRLYRKWLDGAVTEAERKPGAGGFRAWLSPANLTIAAMVSVFAHFGFGLSLIVGLMLTCLALAAWPLLHQTATERGLGPQREITGPAFEDLSAEREKVLAMLEAGKITVDESAELLNALGSSTRANAPAAPPLTPARRLTSLGAALVVLGFFLPWLEIDGHQEISRMMEMMPPAMGAIASGRSPVEHTDVFPAKMRWQISGGSLAHGTGWAVLLLAIAAAAIPYFDRSLDPTTQRNLRFLALAVGGFIVVYVLSTSLRHIAIGLVVVIAGYALEFIGTLKEERA